MAIIEGDITVSTIRCVLDDKQDMWDVFQKLMEDGYYTGGGVTRDVTTGDYKVEVNREGATPSVTGFIGQVIVAINGPAEAMSKAEYDERYPNA